MNYRHVFHAGNFADVHKHVVLTRILDYLRQKPAPFRVIDSHAGAGLYDLAGPEAERSGEWRAGAGQVFDALRTGALAAAAKMIAAQQRPCRPTAVTSSTASNSMLPRASPTRSVWCRLTANPPRP